MSIRTVIVGLLAALCGVLATAGVLMLNKNRPTPVEEKRQIVVAKINIEMGQEITGNVLSQIDWYSSEMPPGAMPDPKMFIGKFANGNINAGEVLTSGRVGDSPTTLLPANGMRAFAIEAKSVSTNVGRNLVPGNRVDIIWQTSGKLDKELDPVSVRLLQNVKILAVGQVQGDTDNAQKSITLEVKPRMDEDLAFSQAFGNLSLSLRNPRDNEGVEPIEKVNFATLLGEKAAEVKRQKDLANRPPEPTAWDQLLGTLTNRVNDLENQLFAPREPMDSTASPDRQAFDRIEKGMRAITIQTPTESTALAGLLEPGDRVDLHLTVNEPEKKIVLTEPLDLQVPSETLITNIEVLAVDTKLYTINSEGEKKMSRSVTLIVNEDMQDDIARADKLGTLTLTLRGKMDRMEGPPTMVMTVDEFVQRHMRVVSNTQELKPSPKIRTYRGIATEEVPFFVPLFGKSSSL